MCQNVIGWTENKTHKGVCTPFMDVLVYYTCKIGYLEYTFSKVVISTRHSQVFTKVFMVEIVTCLENERERRKFDGWVSHPSYVLS